MSLPWHTYCSRLVMSNFTRALLSAALLASLEVGCTSDTGDDGPESGDVNLSEEGLSSYRTTNEEFEAFVAKSIGALPHDLAQAGRASATRRKHLHDQLIDDEGFGLYYGTEGEWRPKKDAPGVKHPMIGSNCFAWSLEVTGDAFRAAGQASDWRAMAAVVRKDVRGTTFARVLQEHGWTIVYWNPDVDHPVDGKAWKGNYNVAVRHGGYYARLGGPTRVDDVIVNYTPNPNESTEQDLTAYARLKDVPFYFGVAEGGTHTFVGFEGKVSEFHWTADGNDKDALTEVELKDWYDDSGIADGGRRTQWSDGVLAIPPGVWQATRG
jgi:hypothetical protein